MSAANVDRQLIRQARQLARRECANYAGGICLPEDSPCHVIHQRYHTIHDGAIDCDWFLSAVALLQPELCASIVHEIFRSEAETGEGWKECERCHIPFLPNSNRQRYCSACGKEAKRERSRAKQKRYRERKKSSESVTL